MAGTDLERIKAITKRLLDVEITHTKYWPEIAQHPFTNTGRIPYQDEQGEWQFGILEKGSEAFTRWRAKLIEFIDSADSVMSIYVMLNKPWCMYFLRLTEPLLSVEDFTELFKDAFTEMEQPNMDPNVSVTQLKTYFKKCDRASLMDEEEQEEYDNLPDVVTVYRGVTSYNNKKLKVLSWTVDPDVAEWFADRYQQRGQVYKATISKKHIFAYFGGRNEAEVIVDPTKLKDITLFKDLSEEDNEEE